MTDKSILVQMFDGEARLVLNRPESHNPIDAVMIDQMAEELRRLAADPSVRVVTLRGAGASF